MTKGELVKIMRDPKVEAKLKEWDYIFRYHSAIDFTLIDILGAKDNPARYGKPIDQERIDNMSVAAKSGSEFPAIVVCRNIDPGLYRYNLGEGSGLHRVLAMRKAGISECDCYVVSEPDADKRKMLPTLLNAIEGQTNSAVDRYRAILDALTNKFGNRDTLCGAYAVKVSNYNNWEKLEKLKQRLERMGYSPAKFNNEIIKEFGKITNDRVLQRVISFVLDYKISLSGVQELLRDLDNCAVREEASWITVVEKHIAKQPRPSQGNIKARQRLACDKWCDYINNALSLWNREKQNVIDGPEDRVGCCIDDALHMLKVLKGEHMKRVNFKRSA